MRSNTEDATRESSREDTKTRINYRNSLQAFTKRLFDIAFSFMGLTVLSLVFLLIGLAIKRESPGPVYYHADRMGRHGKPFRMLKFRTMYETPENHRGAPITSSEDPRITPIGHWLRDTKLNELPQLWNVLKGEMSLVGPRPENMEIAASWPADAREEILSVRPGITSPASVIYRDEEKLLKGSGFLDEYLKTILPDKLRLDQLFVRNQSILVEMDVLAMTFVTLLPAIRSKKVDERWLYGGLFFNFYRKLFSWLWADMLVTGLSVGLSGIVWRLSAVINLGIPTFIIVAIAIAMLFSLINLAIGLNKIDWAKASPVFIIDLAFSTALTVSIIWVINRNWLVDPWIPFSMLWLMGLTIFIGVVAVRFRERLITGLANRWLLFRGSKTSLAERILIIGAGNLGEMTLWLLNRSAYSSIFGVVGMVDDDHRKRGSQIMGLNVIGSTKDIPELVNKYGIGLIFFAISDCPEPRLQDLIAICESTGARTVIVPDLVKVLERSIKKIEVVDQT